MRDTDGSARAFDTLGEARRHGTALALAMAVSDELSMIVIATRLRQSIEIATSELDRPPLPADHEHVVAALQQLVESTRPLFKAARARDPGFDVDRVVRWGRVRKHPHAERPDQDPDLFELEAVETCLVDANFDQLYVAQSQLRSGCFEGATFMNSLFEDCDLSRANLARTQWRGARLVRCSLAGSVLVDANLDAVTFVDCDLRGADLAAVKRQPVATTRSAELLRCDLRETNWDGRTLEGTRFGDCKVYGAHGVPRVEGVEIENADLSMAGDGSTIGRAVDVLALWDIPSQPRR